MNSTVVSNTDANDEQYYNNSIYKGTESKQTEKFPSTLRNKSTKDNHKH